MANGYAALGAALAKNFTVHIIERRGRGASGPQGTQYGVVKECEDLAAVQAKTGAGFVIGQSYGGFVALEAARNNPHITKLALYEPGVSIDGSIPTDWIKGYEQGLTENKPLDAFIAFIKSMNPQSRKTPNWMLKRILPHALGKKDFQQTMELLPSGLREHLEEIRFDNTYKNYRDISAEVLLMFGGKESPTNANTLGKGLAEVLPSSQTQVFPKLDHFGIDKGAPTEVAKVVTEFFQ
jgi:pimeloyl-ACP methyl ester carboxylesterase